MILFNQTRYVFIPSILLSSMVYVITCQLDHHRLRSGCVKFPDQQLTIVACENDLSFLYKHVIGALDSLGCWYVGIGIFHYIIQCCHLFWWYWKSLILNLRDLLKSLTSLGNGTHYKWGEKIWEKWYFLYFR